MSSHFTDKPILLKRGAALFFVEHARRAEFESLPGKRWAGYSQAHFCAGKFFTIDADGSCRACRHGGTCRAIKVAVLDITHSPMPRVPVRKQRTYKPRLSATERGINREQERASFTSLETRKYLRLDAFVAKLSAERALSPEEVAQVRTKLQRALGVADEPPVGHDVDPFGPMLREFAPSQGGRARLSIASDADLDEEILQVAESLKL